MKYGFEDPLEASNSPPTRERVQTAATKAAAATALSSSKSPFDSTLSPMALAESPVANNKDVSMITTRRSRPTLYAPGSSSSSATKDFFVSPSGMTPDAKRLKQQQLDKDTATPTTNSDKAPVFRIEYPDSNKIPVPSKPTLRNLLKQALKSKQQDQLDLAAPGILSLQHVLLPAIALQEEAALKKVQAKIQRDAPENKAVVEEGRRLIRASIRNAMLAVEANRHKRNQLQEIRRQEATARAQQEKLVLRQERERQRQLDLESKRQTAEEVRLQRLKDLKRQHNRKLYTEIVSLTRSITQLQKEEKMWKEALEKQEEWKAAAPVNNHATDDDDADSTPDTGEAGKNVAALLKERTSVTIQDMILASKRIQQGLSHVSEIMKDSQLTQQQLYKEYRQNHHFQGYQGVRNPRDLIRFLSQED